MRLPVVLGLLITFVFSTLSAQSRVRLEVPYSGGMVVVVSDQMTRESADHWTAQGNVVMTYQDTVLKCDSLDYNSASDTAIVEGHVEISRGVQWLKASRGELNLKTDMGVLYDVEGFTDQELYVRAKRLLKVGRNEYIAQNGFLTSCGDAVPKWSFSVKNAEINTESTARFTNTWFRVKNIPLFYLPVVYFPTGKKERSSGFVLPTTGNSSNKGRRLSEAFYLVLGRSADLMYRQDYFSKRGWGEGLTFRTRPNDTSYLELDGYTVQDRKNQGGASLNGVGQTYFGNGYRAVADFNLVSNFTFRQVFSDNFYTATRPTENSRLFVTNDSLFGSPSIFLSREETIFPVRNVVIRHTPSLATRWIGRRLPFLPVYFDMESSLDGLSRTDQFLQTTGVTERLDLFPQFYSSVPLFQGLRLTPRLGLRETYYTDSRKAGEEVQGNNLSDSNLNRDYMEFTLDLDGWGLSKVYSDGNGGGWKHLIEPAVRYRYITGIDNFQQIIPFDPTDTIVDTNQIEYALFNRIFVKRRSDTGTTTHEWLSVAISQQYFFDPTFGGALQPGNLNQFYPLNTLTGFPYASIPRNFSPVTTLIRITPQPGRNFDIRGDYDPHYGTLRDFAITGFWRGRRLSVGTSYFVTQKLEPGSFESNQLQGQLSYGNLTRGLSLTGSFSYDARTSRFLSSFSRLNYFWDCFGISVEAQSFNVGLRQERQIRFSFYLKGIGTFGTIKRPVNVY